MAHEIDDKAAKKREMDMKNGRPVDAEDDEDDKTDEDEVDAYPQKAIEKGD